MKLEELKTEQKQITQQIQELTNQLLFITNIIENEENGG